MKFANRISQAGMMLVMALFLQSDSIIAPAVRYYENHGTPDERLKMYYYSGRIMQNIT